MKVVIIMGSASDESHAKKITDNLDELSIKWEQPLEVLKILTDNENEESLVYVTIAGRSNALSGFVGANSKFPTIGCPPFTDKTDMLVNIHSTLQMPSNTPVLTILDPKNCAISISRIFKV